jgi:hypothetical protein
MAAGGAKGRLDGSLVTASADSTYATPLFSGGDHAADKIPGADYDGVFADA